MKKIRSFSLFLALLLLFSFTSCENESGEITTEYIKTLDTEVITDTTSITEPETEAQTEPEDTVEVTESPVTTDSPIVTNRPEVTTVPEPETTAEPEVTTVPEPETTAEPEVTTVPEPETTAEPEVTTVPEPETTEEPEETTEPEDPGYSDYELAPDFTVFDAYGNSVRLSDMRGKPVVLNFWASWCPPCKAEMPDFDKVYRELGDEVVFMMVNVWDTQSDAEAIINLMGYSFPVYYDFWESAVAAYGIDSIPQTYFIDKWGGFVAYGVGALSEDELRYGISMIYN